MEEGNHKSEKTQLEMLAYESKYAAILRLLIPLETLMTSWLRLRIEYLNWKHNIYRITVRPGISLRVLMDSTKGKKVYSLSDFIDLKQL